MAFPVKSNNKLPLTAQPEDKFHNDIASASVPIPPSPLWSLTNPAVAQLVVDESDPWKAMFIPIGPLGKTFVKCAYGSKEGQMEFEVVAGDVAFIEIQPGAPLANN